MKKRFLSLGLVLTLMLTLCSGMAFAAEPRGSSTLFYYPVGVSKGENAGEIRISYDVQANQEADELGVASIKIYRSSGSYVTTITGTIENGLIDTNEFSHRSSYIYEGTSGLTYYAEVTVFAKIGTDFDSRVVTTPTITAP